MTDKIKKIDIHAHATAFPEFCCLHGEQQWLSAEEQLQVYRQLNIEKGVLLPVVSPEDQWLPLGNESCWQLTRQYPECFVWFCNVDPRAGHNHPKSDLSSLLMHYKELGARGVGEITSHLYADDPLVDNLFYHCAEMEMPVILHLAPRMGCGYGLVDEMGLPRLERMLKKHPNLILIGHSQPFWAELSSDLAEQDRDGYPKGKISEGRLPWLMREYGNLYCDLSAWSGANALMRDPEYAASFLAEFSDRILYGCDICSIQQTQGVELDRFLDNMVSGGQLSISVYEKIIRTNAMRILKEI